MLGGRGSVGKGVLSPLTGKSFHMVIEWQRRAGGAGAGVHST